MRIREFERKIKHLTQMEIINCALSVLGHMIIKKGIATEEELQNKFLEVMPKKIKKTRRMR
ncbi:MAG: hypothetical protein HYT37_00105 [Candidatus Sungbacteria bacterium]|nr:hypothetical protein [Candidatus Sungbacteria bacterium]